MKKVLYTLAFFALLLTSCSPKLTPFSQRLYENHDWNEDELKSIQFYLSHDVILKREIAKGSSEIISGKIKEEYGKKIEVITIPAKTPGVLIFIPKRNRFAVSFEAHDDGKFLMFGPNPKNGNRYVLLAKEWKKRNGKVTYEDRVYTTDPNSALATLMVDLKKVDKIGVRRHVAGGRTVNN